MAIATLVAVALLAHSNVPASSKAAPPRSTSSSSPHAVAMVTRAATDTALPGVDKAARARPNRVSPPTPTPPEPAIIKPKGPIPLLVSASVRATIKKCYNRTQNVWLTFDDGYTSQANLDSILATLKKYNVRGRFFPTGSWARTHASMVNQIRAEGHYVENHTGNHAHLNRLDDAAVSNEIATGQAASSSPKLLRPPVRRRRLHEQGVLPCGATGLPAVHLGHGHDGLGPHARVGDHQEGGDR